MLRRFINIDLPRVRDFRGLARRGFDGMGNFTLGIKEQTIFVEIDIDKISRTFGMDISFVTSAKTDDEGRALLEELMRRFGLCRICFREMALAGEIPGITKSSW